MSGAVMTAREMADAIGRAHALCAAEVSAARDEYDEGRRKIAAVRKERSVKARAERDRQVRDLREQFARERQGVRG